MCIASRMMKDVRQAQVGDIVQVGKMGSGHSDQKMFVLPVLGCLVCVPFGAVINIANLPGSLRARLGTGPEVQVRMVSFDEDRTEFHQNRDDVFEYAGGTEPRRFKLSELPVGTSLTIVDINVVGPEFSITGARQEEREAALV